jgi:23S rRNA pseudouridine2604 synthase
MCSALGYRVQHLRRVRIINIGLGSLAPGQWRELDEAEVEGLLPRQI